MLKDRFRGSETMEIIHDPNKYFVRLHCSTVYSDPLERDVTQLIKTKPYTTLVELIKHAARSLVDEDETAGFSTRFVETWEQSSRGYFPRLTIWALDKERQPREFYDCIEKRHGEASGIDLWPTARAKDLFEKKSKRKYRLDLFIGLMVI